MASSGGMFPRSAEPSKDREVLLKQVADLQRRNAHLAELLDVAQTKAITISSVLFKYRPYGLAILSNDWEQRYVMLYGSIIKWFKSERDITTPRGRIDITGCVVEWEGLKGNHYTFGIIAPSGANLLRLSTDNKMLAEKWVSALEAAGCQRKTVSALARTRSPLPSADMRFSSAERTRPPSSDALSRLKKMQKLQQRWEESSTDGEVEPRRLSRFQDIDEDRPTTSRAAQSSESAEAKFQGPMLGSTPVHHTSKYSPLSSERIIFQQHSGLINLGMVIIICTNFRLILENILKYGLRFNPVHYVRRALAGKGNLPLVMCFPALLAFAVSTLGIQMLAHVCLQQEQQLRSAEAKKREGSGEGVMAAVRWGQSVEWFIFCLNAFITTATLVVPCYIIHYTQSEPIPGMVLMLCTVVLWMKLVSYAHCNYDLRQARRAGQLRVGESGHLQTPPELAVLRYPQNLTLKNLLYFVAAPTLTYQVNYPRNSRLRKRWLLRRVAELLVWLGVLLFIVEQYIEPTISNSMVPLRNLDVARLLERILKLSLPNLYAWLCMFYALFHLWLNILAELLRFGDREFYKQWWNANTIGEYWRLWNMPVHKWMLRSVYFPAIRWGVSKFWAMMLVFFVSAVFHELCVGVPLHMVKFWAFLGIMAQVPLVMITEAIRKKLKNDVLGNIVFWVTFCVLGQPLSMLMYYHDYVVDNRPDLLHPPTPMKSLLNQTCAMNSTAVAPA